LKGNFDGWRSNETSTSQGEEITWQSHYIKTLPIYLICKLAMTSPPLTNSISIHVALHDMATRTLPQHEPNEDALTVAQLEQIKQHEPQGKKHSVRSSLFELKTTQRKR
jgi:hypothetical protein